MRNKIIFSGLVFLILITLLIDNTHGKEIKYVFSLEDEIVYEDTYKSIEVITKDISILIKEKEFIIKVKNEQIKIPDNYITYSYINNQLYVLSENKLYEVNLELLSYISIDITIDCCDLLVSDYIYIVGSSESKPSILILNQNKEIEKQKIYEGDGQGKFTNIFLKEDNIFLIGLKDAYFNNEIFLNVGNKGDTKSFILSTDKSLKEKDIYHFNENKKYEEITSYIFDDSIDIILKSSTSHYYYSFNQNLKLIDYRLLSDNSKNVSLIKNDKEKLFIFANEDEFFINLLDDNKLNIVFDLKEELINFNIIDGGIAFTTRSDALKTLIYSEYHILKKEDLVLNRLNNDLEKKDHILVESFFENLEFNIEEITPFYQQTMSGEYKVTYVATNNFGSNIYITTKLFVLDFVNVIDGGIYNINTKLLFFGSGYLNGNLINNGYTLKEVGNYEFVVKNINGIEKIYTFAVVDNYYKDNDNILIPHNYIVSSNESIEIELELSNSKKIKEIIINGSSFENYTVLDNFIYITLAPESFGYREYFIEKIILETDEIILIDKKYIVLSKKRFPYINIDINNRDSYEFNIDVYDPDLSIIDLVFKSDKEMSTYLKEGSYNISDSICYLRYELGDGKIYEQEIFKYVGDNISCSLEIDVEESIQNIKLKLKTNKNTKEIVVDEKNIYNKEKGDKNKIIILITIISSVVILIIMFLLLITRKKKTSKLIKLK